MQEDKEYAYQPLQQEVTGAAYEKALKDLATFGTKDLTLITTLGDLSGDIQIVGKDLMAVVTTNGRIIEDNPESGDKTVSRYYNMTHPLQDKSTLSVDAEAGNIDIWVLDDQGNPFSHVVIPVEENLTSANNSGTVIAMDATNGSQQIYYPVLNPDKPEILRGYAGVVQDGVRKILNFAKQPTPLPSID